MHRSRGARRSLFYRYSPRTLNFVANGYEVAQRPWVSHASPAQRAVLGDAYIYNRPLLENDGVKLETTKRRED